MKILVLGKNGFLGSEIIRCFEKNNIDYLAPPRNKIDITTMQLSAICKSYKPDLIINCVAYTDVDAAEADSETAYKINSEAVENIVNSAEINNSKIIHFSTDYVFDGLNESGYKEEDKTHPINIYGKSKLSGEKILTESNSNFIIIRTSFPFGNSSKCFLQKILKRAEDYGYLKVVDNFVSSPTYFFELAERVLSFTKEFPEKGIYHLSNFGSCSRYEFAVQAVKILNLDIKVEPFEHIEVNTIAERPRSSILINTKLDLMSPWTEALEKYLTKN